MLTTLIFGHAFIASNSFNDAGKRFQSFKNQTTRIAESIN
jgi:hypothetical protein